MNEMDGSAGMPPVWPLYRRAVKRALDVGLSSAALLVVGVPLLLLGLLVRATSPGPALFRQLRVGRGGRPFRIWKLRTMSDSAAGGPAITVGGDPRVTALGRVLRRTKLDELPQLVNVLIGDMSLVGPRPEVPAYVALYSPEQREVLTVRPGITDFASLVFRDEEAVLRGFPDSERGYREVVLPRKLELARQYLREQSLVTDVKVLLKTAAALAR
jgi:lipopolysaccharide/colanic/teichoic acid biosynthesis glycosyltransferase